MKKILLAVWLVILGWFCNIAILFGVVLGIIWVVVSAAYLLVVSGESLIAGHLITLAQIDGFGFNSYHERPLLYAALIFWSAVILYYLWHEVKVKLKEMDKRETVQ